MEQYSLGRYFLAYVIPAGAGLGIYLGGLWSWWTVFLVYVLVPVADQALGLDRRNPASASLLPLSRSRTADWPLYLALPVQVGLILFLLQAMQAAEPLWVKLGWVVSVGLSAGGLGIVVAHELVHRRQRFEYWLGKLLLMTVLYMHFAIEHVRGHHARVATDADPASARLGQSVYGFVLQSVWRQWPSAWQLEVDRLQKKQLPVWSLHNEMLGMVLCQGLWLIGIAFFFGLTGLLAAVSIAVIAFTLLEVVNYVEHYGLRRKVDAAGRLEPVRSHHSWNSDHRMSRILLFELPRHTDHHMNGSRPYQTLHSVEGAPQLPAGYPAMVLLALIPPLWFRIMNPRVAAVSA